MNNKQWFNQANTDNMHTYDRSFNTVDARSTLDGLKIDKRVSEWQAEALMGGSMLILTVLVLLWALETLS